MNNLTKYYPEENVTRVDAMYIMAGVVAIYILEHQGKCAIIETGTSHSVKYVEQALNVRNLSFDDVLYVIPTHVHLDHAGGAGALMQRCNNAQLVVHPFGAKHLINPEKLIAGTMAVYGEEYFKKVYGEIVPIDESRVIEAEHDFELSMNGRTLKFIDTPGHARHHFCIYDKETQSFFTGDTYGLSYPQLTPADSRFIFPTTTPVQFNPDDLVQSIENIMSHQPKAIFLTHYGKIVPNQKLVEQLKSSIQAYVDIALKTKEMTENRVEIIEQELMQFLLNELSQHSPLLSEKENRAVLAGDVKLNAQGLDVWMSRMN